MDKGFKIIGGICLVIFLIIMLTMMNFIFPNKEQAMYDYAEYYLTINAIRYFIISFVFLFLGIKLLFKK